MHTCGDVRSIDVARHNATHVGAMTAHLIPSVAVLPVRVLHHLAVLGVSLGRCEVTLRHVALRVVEVARVDVQAGVGNRRHLSIASQTRSSVRSGAKIATHLGGLLDASGSKVEQLRSEGQRHLVDGFLLGEGRRQIGQACF